MSLALRLVRRSALGFGPAFANREHLDSDFHDLFIKPLLSSNAEAARQLSVLRTSTGVGSTSSEPSMPALVLGLRRDDLELRFLTTITLLNAPQNVMLEELRIDTYYPLDDATANACRRIAEQRSFNDQRRG